MLVQPPAGANIRLGCLPDLYQGCARATTLLALLPKHLQVFSILDHLMHHSQQLTGYAAAAVV